MTTPRERKVLSGRTNLHRNEATGSYPRHMKNSEWNDTLKFHRPFSPKDPFYTEQHALPPILPRSAYPTIPEMEPLERPRRRPMTCPSNWLNEKQRPDPLEKSSLRGHLSEEERTKCCKEFINRNQNQLWKYDQNYTKKTPRTLCKDIVEDRNFMGIMSRNYSREKVLKLSGSDATRNCLQFEEDLRVIPESHSNINDPFIMTMNTSRQNRDVKRLDILKTGLVMSNNRRGYEHVPEYGNFSHYNTILKNNQAAVLKR